ncbi:MAG: Bug family tripartite tricarboxylate transporter substrate binding protein [Burkholderiales bacterium]
MRRVLAVTIVLVAAAVIGQVQAQSYPVKPIRFVIPFPPGGGTDILGRALAPKVAEGLGQQVVVENRGGAGGNIGSEYVAKAAPDGYTLLLGANTLAINATLYQKLGFDPMKDFTAVTMLALGPMVLVAHPGVPAKNVRELIALAKRDASKLNFSSPGNGTPHHIAGELFNRMAGVSITHIPYKGGGPALADVLAGQTQFSFLTMGTVKPHIEAGKLVALGLASGRRSEVAPAIPTIAESGVPGYAAELWYGVFAPRGTPREIVQRLHAEFIKAIAAPDVKERVLGQGFEIWTSTPDELEKILASDFDKYARVIREGNIRAE